MEAFKKQFSLMFGAQTDAQEPKEIDDYRKQMLVLMTKLRVAEIEISNYELLRECDIMVIDKQQTIIQALKDEINQLKYYKDN